MFPRWAVRVWFPSQIMESVDGLAYITESNGVTPDVSMLRPGDSGMGMTHGTIAGILLTDLVRGRPNPWADVYDPSRVRLGATQEFARGTQTRPSPYYGMDYERKHPSRWNTFFNLGASFKAVIKNRPLQNNVAYSAWSPPYPVGCVVLPGIHRKKSPGIAHVMDSVSTNWRGQNGALSDLVL